MTKPEPSQVNLEANLVTFVRRNNRFGVPEISFLFQTRILCPKELADRAEPNSSQTGSCRDGKMAPEAKIIVWHKDKVRGLTASVRLTKRMFLTTEFFKQLSVPWFHATQRIDFIILFPFYIFSRAETTLIRRHTCINLLIVIYLHISGMIGVLIFS